MSRHTPRSRKYWRLRHIVRTEEPNCWLCGRPIDPALKWPNPWMFTTDHVFPASTHPHLKEERSNMRAAHLRCNQSRQTGGHRRAVDPSQIYISEDI